MLKTVFCPTSSESLLGENNQKSFNSGILENIEKSQKTQNIYNPLKSYFEILEQIDEN